MRFAYLINYFEKRKRIALPFRRDRVNFLNFHLNTWRLSRIKLFSDIWRIFFVRVINSRSNYSAHGTRAMHPAAIFPVLKKFLEIGNIFYRVTNNWIKSYFHVQSKSSQCREYSIWNDFRFETEVLNPINLHYYFMNICEYCKNISSFKRRIDSYFKYLCSKHRNE